MKVLITGIAGFIGSHLGEYLLAAGNEVIGIDNFDPYYLKAIKENNLKILQRDKRFSFYDMDVRKRQTINALFKKHKVDLVIHLAAKVGVRPSIESVFEYYDVNLHGTVNILECMRQNGIKNLIFASSSSVYGNNEKVPFNECDVVDNQISPYAATKKSGELLCHVYNHLYGININCLRFFTVYGPRQRPDLAIHKFTRHIDLGIPISVFGDGSTARDYTFIEDIIEGIKCSINHLDGFHIYNLGESKVIKLNALIKLIERALGKTAILDYQPMQAGDVQQTYADISLARKELGYNPKFDMETGIQIFMEWYLANKCFLYQ